MENIYQRFEQEFMQKNSQVEIILYQLDHIFRTWWWLHLYIFSWIFQSYLQNKCQAPYFLTDDLTGLNSLSLKHI